MRDDLPARWVGHPDLVGLSPAPNQPGMPTKLIPPKSEILTVRTTTFEPADCRAYMPPMAQEQTPPRVTRKTRAPFAPPSRLPGPSEFEAREGAARDALKCEARTEAEEAAEARGQRLALEEERANLPLQDDEEEYLSEEAAAELLAETDRAVEAIARHADRTDALLEQIKAVRAETLV